MKKSTSRRNHVSRLAGGALIATALLVQGCLQRPVTKQSPNTSNIFVEQIINSSINEIDMLFVIDNSVSMGDKQDILSVAVPKMVERLLTPNCVDGDKNVVGKSVLQGFDAQGNPLPPSCENGQLEFVPVNDIHLGVISSSLGGHGSGACPRDYTDNNGVIWYQDDRGHLIPSVRSGVDQGQDGMGFLAWNGGTATDAEDLDKAFTAHVMAVGEHGCGFEAPLEAWYRFLVDPIPPDSIVLAGSKGDQAAAATDASGAVIADNTVLQQREKFLRPEGLVAIVILTDENDCSIMDGGDYYNNAKYGYLLATTKMKNNAGKDVNFYMPAATAECDSNPNHKCCMSCLQTNNPPSECAASITAACSNAEEPDPTLDAGNVRCFDNKRRFGVDLLYPTQRYVDALTRTEIVEARSKQLVSNPLLQGKGGVRPPGRVFLAGIVGVPWQDIATPDSYDTSHPEYSPDRMRYLTAKDLSEPNVTVGGVAINRWDMILGQPNLPATSQTCQEQKNNPACGLAPVPPADPFMIEQIGPRMVGAAHPLLPAERISSPDSTNPQENKINGHEYNTGIPDRKAGETGGNASINDDLQYACIFPLETPKTVEECAGSVSCDCAKEPSRNRPLCQPAGGGGTQAAQYWGKAYPGTRILEVLRDFGANSIVGSICPKVTDDRNKADYGYNPAVQAIVDRLAEKLVGACLPRELTLSAEGKLPCFVVEAKAPVDITDPNDTPLNCAADGRGEPSEQVKNAVRKQLAETKLCADDDHQVASNVRCSDFTMCEILPLVEGAGLGECLYNTAPAESLEDAGFCYIDPAKTSEDGLTYIAGGSREEAGRANHPDTVPQDGTNLIVADCPATQRRLLRFVGKEKTPAVGSITMVACTGDAAGSDDDISVAPMPSTSGD